jgi:carboxypeptidase C (cathepsin A)
MLRLAAPLLAAAALLAQAPPPAPAAAEPAPVTRKHTGTWNGRELRYTTTTGRLPLLDEKGGVEAHIFFVAYTLDDPPARRPLMFAFNGGPGSASVWLHMGVLGPKIVRMQPDGSYPPPPFELADNPHSFLPFTDMVFIDPVGTGYSRAARPELGKKFFGVEGDIASVGEFIRLWLTRYQRWHSPLYLTGESYGTFRAAGLAGYLVERGVAFNGICLVSSILQYQTVRFNPGNDLPYSLFLPTYTAIAHYHRKLEPGLQASFREAVKESEDYALNEYPVVLAKGDRLTPAERQKAIDKLHRLTGLDKAFLDRNDLRIEINRFTKELLRDQGATVGRLDGRLTGVEGSNGAAVPEFDPSLAAIRAPYTALFNDYVRRQLGYERDLEYFILGGGIGPWDYGKDGSNRYAETAGALRLAFAKNPALRVYIGSGYYDLATPYFATEYTFSHMGLPAKYKGQIVTKMYPAGHMFYAEQSSLAALTRDIAAFVK